MSADGCGVELSTNLREVFTITEKAFSWLKAPTSTFTFKTLLRYIGNVAFVSSSNVGPTPPTIKYEIVFTNDSTKKLAKFANIF